MLHVPPLALSRPLPLRSQDGPHVTILMATRNGARWLPAQLDSILAQTHRAWSLWVSDDGSTDDTTAIVLDFARRHPRHDVRLFDGPGKGVAANFLSLLLRDDLPSGAVALSDQDDVWLPYKLDRALREVAARRSQAVLYGAQSLHVGPDLWPTGRSRTMRARPSFGNALVQNVISGHSAVLSDEAVALVRRAGDPGAVPFHDWWLYLLLSAAGARVVIDPKAVLLYRQHDANRMGAHDGVRAHLRRAASIARGEYRDWIGRNLVALQGARPLLTDAARTALDRLDDPDGQSRLARLRALRLAGARRNTALGDAVVALAVLAGRV